MAVQPIAGCLSSTAPCLYVPSFLICEIHVLADMFQRTLRGRTSPANPLWSFRHPQGVIHGQLSLPEWFQAVHPGQKWHWEILNYTRSGAVASSFCTEMTFPVYSLSASHYTLREYDAADGVWPKRLKSTEPTGAPLPSLWCLHFCRRSAIFHFFPFSFSFFHLTFLFLFWALCLFPPEGATDPLKTWDHVKKEPKKREGNPPQHIIWLLIVFQIMVLTSGVGNHHERRVDPTDPQKYVFFFMFQWRKKARSYPIFSWDLEISDLSHFPFSSHISLFGVFPFLKRTMKKKIGRLIFWTISIFSLPISRISAPLML